jgi:hypothetical protein
MRKWLYDNPWIWVALFLAALVAGSMVTLVIAQINRPEIVKEKRAGTGTSLLLSVPPDVSQSASGLRWSCQVHIPRPRQGFEFRIFGRREQTSS